MLDIKKEKKKKKNVDYILEIWPYIEAIRSPQTRRSITDKPWKT